MSQHYNCESCGNPCMVANGVWVLSRGDGNVCCPAEEWVSIHATQESAEAAKAAAVAARRPGDPDADDYDVTHWPVMPRTPE